MSACSKTKRNGKIQIDEVTHLPLKERERQTNRKKNALDFVGSET